MSLIDTGLIQAISLVNNVYTTDRQYTNISKKLQVNFLHDVTTHSGLSDLDYPFNPLNPAHNPSKGPLGLREISEIRHMPYPDDVLRKITDLKYKMTAGVFAEIFRAWVIVDDSFFIFDYSNSYVASYSNGVDNILLAGVLKPKPGVFHKDFKDILVLVTVKEILMIGLIIDLANDSTRLLSNPLFQLDNDRQHSMTTLVCTDDGRVITSSSDGNLYEIDYSGKKGYIFDNKKKINLTESYLSNLIPSFISSKSPEITIMVDDPSRHLLYTLNSLGTIDAYSIVDGKCDHIGSLTKESIQRTVAKIIQHVVILHGEIIHLAPQVMSDSRDIHLVAVTNQGIRYYFTTENTGHITRDIYGNPTFPSGPRTNPAAPAPAPHSMNTSAASYASQQVFVHSPAQPQNPMFNHTAGAAHAMGVMGQAGAAPPLHQQQHQQQQQQMPTNPTEDLDDQQLRRRHQQLEQRMLYHPCKLSLLHVRLPPNYNSTQIPRCIEILPAQKAIYCDDNMFLVSKCSEDSEIIYTASGDSYPFMSCMQENFVGESFRGIETLGIYALPSDAVIPAHKYLDPLDSLKSRPPLTSTQNLFHKRTYVIVNTSGIFSFQKLRPVDALKNLIHEYSIDSEFVQFYFQHRKEEACSTSLIILTDSNEEPTLSNMVSHAFWIYGGNPTINPHITGDTSTTRVLLQPIPAIDLSKQRKEVLKNLPVQRISWSDTVFNTMSSMIKSAVAPIAPTKTASNQFAKITNASMLHDQCTDFDITKLPGGSKDKEEICNPPTADKYGIVFNNNIELSNRHKGICIYLARILKPFWNHTVIVPHIVGKNCLITSRYTNEETQWLIDKLIELNQFLVKNIPIQKQTHNIPHYDQEAMIKQQACSYETASMILIQSLVVHIGEVLSMWITLCEHQIYDVFNSLSKEEQEEFNTLTLQSLVLGGKKLNMRLLTAVIEMHVKQDRPTDDISNRLMIHCPSLYNQADSISAKANELIKHAQTMGPSQKQELMDESLKMLCSIADCVDVDRVVAQYINADYFIGVVRLCHAAASARDPGRLADNHYARGEPMEDVQGRRFYDIRQECYRPIIEQLDNLIACYKEIKNNKPTTYSTDPAVIKLDQNIIIMTKTAFENDDELLHVVFFRWLLSNKFESIIICGGSKYLEAFLLKCTCLQPDNIHLRNLLSEHYQYVKEYGKARDILVEASLKVGNNLPLSERVDLLEQAMAYGDEHHQNFSRKQSPANQINQDNEKYDINRNRLQLAKVQQQILKIFEDKIKVTTDQSNLDEMMRIANGELGYSLLDCEKLYQDYAVKYQLIETEMMLLKMCNCYDEQSLLDLWRALIDNATNDCKDQCLMNQMQSVHDAVVRVGKFMCSADAVFYPLEEIILMLEVKSLQHNFYTVNPSYVPCIAVRIRDDLFCLIKHYLRVFVENRTVFANLGRPFHLIPVMVILFEEYIQKFNSNQMHESDKRETLPTIKLMVRTLTDAVEMNSDLDSTEKNDLVSTLTCVMDQITMMSTSQSVLF